MKASSRPDYKQLYKQSQQQLQEALQVIGVLREQIEGLHEHIAVLNKVIATQQQTIAEQQKQLERIPVLEHELDQLRRMVYGRKSERFTGGEDTQENRGQPGPGGQLTLDMQAEKVEACSVAEAQKISYTRAKQEKKPHPSRKALDKLPKKVSVLQPDQVPENAIQIGIEKTRQLHYKAPELWVEELHRPVYLVATDTETQTSRMLIAPLPPHPIDKCMAGASLLAHLVVEKYVYHIPVNRQRARLVAQGVSIPYSTLVDWVNRVADLLLSLYLALSEEILGSGYVHGDETPLRVIDGEKPRYHQSHLGYLWGFHNSLLQLVYFTYRPGRAAKHVQDVLTGYSGYLHTDGYQVYDKYAEQPGIIHLQCMAHARRRFEEALKNDRKRASYALEQFFGKLYDIERTAANLSFDDRQSLRQQQALPVLHAFRQWLVHEKDNVLPKTPIGKAINYSLNRIDALSIYVTDGRLAIDNNAIERTIRPIAVGRRNYLFCGSHDAAQRTAILYSLLGTCKLHGINPYDWLHDVLKRLPTCKTKDIKELLPHRWKPVQDKPLITSDL
jgi:transposase